MQSRIPLPLRRPLIATAMLAALASGVVFAEDATVAKKTELRATPAAAADVVGELKAKEAVSVTARQGAWANVSTPAGLTGWARIFNLSFAAGSSARGSGGADLGALFATGSSGAASTTAAKGLNGNDLMNASPNVAGLSQLDSFASNSGDASSFAAAAPVQAQQVAYLPSGRRR